MTKLLEVKNLHKYFGQNRELVKAVNDVSFTLEAGETVGLIGESGCGKSTLARLILGLLEPDRGELILQGKNYREYKGKRLDFYRHIQMVFQNPYDVFDQRFTIGEILERPLKIHHLVENREEAQKKILQSLEEVAIQPAQDFIDRHPYELSGGQLQRIAILRAMLLEPDLLVADEAVSSLDVSVRAEVLNLLLSLKKSRQMTMLFISHDIQTTAYIADKLMVMYFGKIVESGSAEELVLNPQHEYTKALLDSSKSLDVEKQKLVET